MTDGWQGGAPNAFCTWDPKYSSGVHFLDTGFWGCGYDEILWKRRFPTGGKAPSATNLHSAERRFMNREMRCMRDGRGAQKKRDLLAICEIEDPFDSDESAKRTSPAIPCGVQDVHTVLLAIWGGARVASLYNFCTSPPPQHRSGGGGDTGCHCGRGSNCPRTEDP